MTLYEFDGDVFGEFEDETGWDKDSEMFLLFNFLESESKRSPGLWDRLHEFLEEQADDERAENESFLEEKGYDEEDEI